MQQETLRLGLGTRADGSWAAKVVGDFAGRQGGGKTDKIIVRELAGLELYGERLIIHTAHEFPTANEAFMALVALYTDWDDLRKRVHRFYTANGAQGIVFKTGQRILYKARTGGSARGFRKANLIVYDEAQHLTGEHVAASGPAKLSNPNAQSWYAGSGGHAISRQAWALRKRALLGVRGRFAYTECTAETPVIVDGRITAGPPIDVDDRKYWFFANPGLGRWVTMESMEDLRSELGDDLFARECLCLWEPEPGDEGSVLEPGVWISLADRYSKIATHRHIGLDVSPEWTWGTFGAAGRRADGRIHVEAFDRRPGTGWIVARAAELFKKWKVPIRVETKSPAASFTDQMREAGAKVTEISQQQHAAATAQFIDAAKNDQMRHLGGSHLDSALNGAVLRQMGDCTVWGRRLSTSDITPLVSVTIALGGIPNTKARLKPMVVTSSYDRSSS